MSSKRKKKKSDRTQGSHIKQQSCVSQCVAQASEERTEEDTFSTEQESVVEKESLTENQERSEPDSLPKASSSEDAQGRCPAGGEYESAEDEILEAPEEIEEAGETHAEKNSGEEGGKRAATLVVAKGKDILHNAVRYYSRARGRIEPAFKRWYANVQKSIRKFWKRLQNIKLCYRIAGMAAVGVALFAVLLVGIFSWEWFGLVIHQRPVEGTWLMEQSEPITYLTLREDGTAIVTTDGLNVKGDYHILENDVLSFDVSAGNMDVWTGDFQYWATDTGLTLTRISMEAGQHSEPTMENVLQFQKQESNVTEPAGQETPVIDESLLGSWTDESRTVTYTFRQDGSLTIDFQGAYYNAVYTAKDGTLDIITYIPGAESREESNSYTIKENMLSFSNMELFKDSGA